MILSLFLFVPLLTAGAMEEPDLPPCPTQMTYLPQSLPMHCRISPMLPMPPRLPNMPGAPPRPPAFPYPPLGQFPGGFPGGALGGPPGSFPSGPSGGPPGPPPGSPSGMPPGMPPAMAPGMPPGIPPGMPPGMPPPPGFPPGAMPFPMPMPMPMMPSMGGQKLPVVVMPFYSPEPMNKQRLHSHPHPRPRPRPPPNTSSDTDATGTDTSSDTSSSGSSGSAWSDSGSWWKDRITRKGRMKQGRRSGKLNGLGRKHRIRHKGHRHLNTRFNKIRPLEKRDKDRQLNKRVLTPMLQYVNKDGYVIYEKKISKGEAKDWLMEVNDKTDHKQQHESHHTPEPSVFIKKNTMEVVETSSPEEVEVTTEKSQQLRTKKRRLPVKPGRL